MDRTRPAPPPPPPDDAISKAFTRLVAIGTEVHGLAVQAEAVGNVSAARLFRDGLAVISAAETALMEVHPPAASRIAPGDVRHPLA